MNIGKILGNVGKSIIKNVIPGAGLVIDTVNAFLPEDKKIDENTTGQEAVKRINELPPNVQMELMKKELDVEIVKEEEWTKVIEALNQADASGASTRPLIAKKMANTTVYAVIISITTWGASMVMVIIAKWEEPLEVVSVLKDSWPFIASVLGIPSALLRAYFGMREREKKERYRMVSGTNNPVEGLIGKVKNLFK